MRLDKLEYEVLHIILKMREAGPTEANIIQGFINRNIDPECYICSHCGAAVRLGFERIQTFYAIHKEGIESNKCEVMEIAYAEISNIIENKTIVDKIINKFRGRPKSK
jgi:hypothetical protein